MQHLTFRHHMQHATACICTCWSSGSILFDHSNYGSLPADTLIEPGVLHQQIASICSIESTYSAEGQRICLQHQMSECSGIGKLQNHRIVGIERSFWGSSRPITLIKHFPYNRLKVQHGHSGTTTVGMGCHSTRHR